MTVVNLSKTMKSEHFPQEIRPRQREVNISRRKFAQDNGK
ncbi:hypothetical protein HMPREF9136_1864 [Prevotella dentalis DSM 3688]|uniref:Uncharacterized protein n=1 Tax=Prevotella dentalis (strain ATCC 49559 / DSM 3688 / JCM 13448 / NCTC 12043 / ES 2772) TaxID=908937 RepID=F9D4T6_PREDD|nr:hypothetical protein HMPREF9136_1864 [Prevotella dentalis DSM 3688]